MSALSAITKIIYKCFDLKYNNDLLPDKSVPNSPKPIVNGENSNDVESNPTSATPQEKMTNGDNNIVNAEEVTNEQVDPSSEPVASDNENTRVDIPNENPIPEVTSQPLDPATENKTDDNLNEDEKNNESEQKQSDLTSKNDVENKVEEVLHKETETEDKTTDDEAVDTAEKEASNQEVPPEKTNDERVLDAAENKDEQAEDKHNESGDEAEKKSDKDTNKDCDVDMTSESEVRTNTEKNDLLGAVELTPRGDEPVDVDLTNDDSEASKTKDTSEKNSSILKSHLSKPSGINRAHQS